MQNATSLPRRFWTSFTVYSDAGFKTQGTDMFMHTSQAIQYVIGEHQSKCTCVHYAACCMHWVHLTQYPPSTQHLACFETAQVTF